MSDDYNQNAQFPHIDQVSKTSRDVYVKEHEFEPTAAEMLAAMDALLDESDTSTSETVAKKKEVAAKLADHTGSVKDVVDLVAGKVNLITEQIAKVESAYERLYSKIYSDIQSTNINIQDRTEMYNVLEAYKTNLKRKLFALLGKTSPYVEGKCDTSDDDKWTIVHPNAVVHLRDTDEGFRFITVPVLIDPSIKQTVPIKILEFTPVANTDGGIPYFLAEMIISGDLFAFKGYLTSMKINRDGISGENRAAGFDADYLLNEELPFSIKILYDSTRNKIALAFKYEETDDTFTSIVKFDCSINLLVGSGLEIADKNTTISTTIDQTA